MNSVLQHVVYSKKYLQFLILAREEVVWMAPIFNNAYHRWVQAPSRSLSNFCHFHVILGKGFAK